MAAGGMAKQKMRRLKEALVLRKFRPNTSYDDSFVLDGDSRSLTSEDELHWQTQLATENIARGASTMVMVDLCYMAVGLFDFTLVRSAQCMEVSKWLEFLFHFIAYVFPPVAILVFYSCMKRPRKGLYVSTVSCHFLYLLIMGLAPSVHVDVDGSVACAKLARTSLQENGCVHVLMAWILLTPSVLPSKNILHLTWVYIVVGYVGMSSLAHILLDGETEVRWVVRVSWCALVLILVNAMALNKKYYLEKGQRSKFIMDLKHKESTRRILNILEYMVPVHLIAPMLKNPGKVIAEQVECASILFIMFVDFDQTASKLEPHELLDFLNQHFTLFDEICTRHGVTKIETVGEEYVCAVGVVPADVEKSRSHGHQEILGKLITVASEILRLAQENEEVVLKMGIHTGPVVAGVIGNKLPRFRLFGDTINTAARMMQKGLPGEVQFGKETFNSLPEGVDVEHRGKIEMKGKGQVETYLLRRETSGPPAVPQPPPRKRVSFAQTVDIRSSADGAPSGAGRHSEALTARSSRGRSITHLIMDPLGTRASVASTPSVVAPLPSCLKRPRPQRATVAAKPTVEVELTRLEHSPARRATSGSPLLGQAASSSYLTRSWSGGLPAKSISDGSVGSRTEDHAANAAFEKLVQEVCSETAQGGDSREAGESEEDSNILDRARAWVMSFGPGWSSFPKEMEEEFCQWYHESAIVKKFDMRIESHFVMNSVVTAVEITYTVAFTGVFEKEDALSRVRLPIFLASRCLVCVIVLGWRAAYDQEWLKKAPKDVQRRLLASYGLVAALWFVSYEMLTVVLPTNGEDVFTLMFVPVYLIVTTLHPLLFVFSCFYILEAIALMYVSAYFFFNLQFGFSSILVVVGNSVLNAFLSHNHERTLRARYKANRNISHAQDRIEHILNTLMPVQVVEEIRENELHAPPRAHPYRCCTVAQSDLCGFTKLASTRRPEEVVEFIGELFGTFDVLTDEYEIYKVETVGDAYIAGQADVPLTYKNSPMSVVLFGLEMIRAVHEWSRKRGEGVSCRVGVHTGECVGGIVGSEMQRYHLFGRLMTGLEVLESTAPEGRVQVSLACKAAVEAQLREEGREVSIFEPRREERLTTSKGEVHEFEEVGGPTFVAKSYAQIRGQLEV